MRLRHIKNARERISQYPDLIVLEPTVNKGKWQEVFSNNNPIHIEIGMGKGKFIVELARNNPDINYIGIEKFDSVMVTAVEKMANDYPKNIRLMVFDAMGLNEVFVENEIDKIYLNFSDPWPKSGHAKRRLTSPKFLNTYLKFLKKTGELEQKTDNARFFEYSVLSFINEKWQVLDISVDFHTKMENIITTEYEEKFKAKGMPIYYLKVKKED